MEFLPNFPLKEDRTPKLQQQHYGLRLRPVEAQERRGLCPLSKRLPRVLADSTLCPRGLGKPLHKFTFTFMPSLAFDHFSFPRLLLRFCNINSTVLRTTLIILDVILIGNTNSLLQAIISGWGTLESGGKQPNILQEVRASQLSIVIYRATR